jgi:5-methylcytosine-specific restriction enzyme subunit McrC
MFKLVSYWEHFEGKMEDPDFILEEESYRYDFYKKKGSEKCYSIQKGEKGYNISLSYFIGVDWIAENEKAIYVEPKLNKDASQTNYLQMLFSALSHPEIVNYTAELFEIKWDKKYIEITQQQDLITPLLVVQFLRVVQEIVRKGLKKSYYKVEKNLNSRVKGKILVGRTIKENMFRNRPLRTLCSFDEFGVNGLENRLIKKALVFIQRYLPTLKIPQSEKYTSEVFNYIMPAFEFVSDEISINDIKHSKINIFYKEYDEGIQLAKLILKRFGYNITNTQQSTILTPPFWIDMSKLFELYVLGLLKDRFGNAVQYHFTTSWNELDFLLNTDEYKMVIDAKYKTKYQTHYDIEDIRQVSGYARLKSVYKELGMKENEVIDCLIIYPDQAMNYNNIKDSDLFKSPIDKFVHFYKAPINLPVI